MLALFPNLVNYGIDYSARSAYDDGLSFRVSGIYKIKQDGHLENPRVRGGLGASLVELDIQCLNTVHSVNDVE